MPSPAMILRPRPATVLTGGIIALAIIALVGVLNGCSGTSAHGTASASSAARLSSVVTTSTTLPPSGSASSSVAASPSRFTVPTTPTVGASASQAHVLTGSPARPSSRPSSAGSSTARPAGTGTARTSPASTSPASHPPVSVARARCPLPSSGFDCDFQRRILVAQQYAKSRPGTVGIVLRDRNTGAVWRNAFADRTVWTASTIKLAMTVDLFTRQRAGRISLSSHDRTLIQRMLHSSDDSAADELWFAYAGQDHLTYNRDFPAYGLTGLQPQRGFTKFYPYWGFQKCTPDDLDRLMQYVLSRLAVTDRRYIVDQLQHVGPDQQWGVWGAGEAAAPGNKDGWSKELGGWVMNSVGFVGPAQRYVLTIMNSLNGRGGYDAGRATDSRIAQILFGGRF